MKNTPQEDTIIATDALGRPIRGPVVEILMPAESAADATTDGAPAARPALEKIRARLASLKGVGLWRSLDELVETPDFEKALQEEFPQHATAFGQVHRRDFLKLAGASLALGGLTACTKQPKELIVPYVKPPEEVVPGRPLFYATAVSLDGYGIGLLAESHMGRPTKVEGNPEHPASLGAADALCQASVFELYDPDRSTSILRRGIQGSWAALTEELGTVMGNQGMVKGAGIRVLTETVTSPSLAALLNKFLESYPAAHWHQYDPAGGNSARQGALQAFGEYVGTQYAFDKADVVVALDADFLMTGPARLRHARDFASRRDAGGEVKLNRFYAIETVPTVTGTNADHRFVVRASEMEAVARALAHAVGAEVESVPTPYAAWIDAVAEDLKQNGGRSIVIAGNEQPPVVHALAHAMNAALGNAGKTVVYTAPVEAAPGDQQASLRELTTAMQAGEVQVLFVLGVNPVYCAPADLDFAGAFAKVPLRVHLGLYVDETARLCHWHIPQAHYLESWGDVRAFDGTVSMIQPLIEPFYGGKTAHELLAVISGRSGKTAHELVREYWQPRLGVIDFEGAWRKILHDGFVPESRAEARTPQLKAAFAAAYAAAAPKGVEIVFRPGVAMHDGRFANNGWLQELPDPITRITWDNAFLVSPATAERLRLEIEDIAEIRIRGRDVAGPVWIMPGMADETIALQLGYGRTAAGRLGNLVGHNAYALRTVDSPWWSSDAVLIAPKGRHALATTQMHHAIADKEASKRNLIRKATLEDFQRDPTFAQHAHDEVKPTASETMYTSPYDYSKLEQWGMVIDLGRCNGCNACVVACQSENNIPVVGKEQVAKGREMHWIRVDRYYEGDDLANPQILHQPVACMHCENAPCETVCPVGATTHSHDGLNQMVYNRCVGTRYCSNNCPYKVRRFNFLQYTDLVTPVKKPMQNPDVTVRVRGVMEKCTFCVQRISLARIDAKVAAAKAGKENYVLPDGSVVTACQQACPAGAITFGNINDPTRAVAKRKQSPLNYGMLSDQNTRPRTTYLARITNPNPHLAASSTHHDKESHG